jgi:hypothetical protein
MSISKASKYKGYVFNQRTNTLSGPFSGMDFTTIASKDNSAEVYAVTEANKVVKTDLLDLNNPHFSKVVDPIDPTVVFDKDSERGVIATAKGEFIYRNRWLSDPFGDPIIGNGPAIDTITDPLYFKDCYLSIAETNWMHYGSEVYEKELYRVDLSFHPNSIGHLWLFVQNDEGKIEGQYKKAIKDHMKIFTNLRGRRFKIQMFVATHHDYPWALREMAIGYLQGKSF